MLLYWIVFENTHSKTSFNCCHFISPAGTIDTEQWNGHFSKCPKELTNYCVHGECRYIEEQKAPSCKWETSIANGWGWWRLSKEDEKGGIQSKENLKQNIRLPVTVCSCTADRIWMLSPHIFEVVFFVVGVSVVTLGPGVNIWTWTCG